jgi:alpha-L-arabinofuranosidase
VKSGTFIAPIDALDQRYLAPLVPLPYLEVSATCDELRQTVTLFVVNRHAEDGVETTIRLTDFAPAHSVTMIALRR